MANITFDYPRLPANGTYTTVQSGLVALSFPNGAVETIRGDFTYSNGSITGGFVTENLITLGGSTIMSVTNISIPAVAYFSARLSGDAAGVANLFFGGSDQIFGATGADILGGLGGNDSIIALDGNDTVDGGAGDDDVNGNVGLDLVFGGEGADWVRGGKDNDTIYGGNGDDLHVNGNIGDDVVLGEAGNDTVYGGQGSDTLNGGAGNDLLSGDLGDDVLFGEVGADRFVLRAGAGSDIVADFNASEGDRVEIHGATNFTYGLVNGNVAYELSDGSRIVLHGLSDLSQATSWFVFV